MPEDIIQIYKADITDLQKKAKASADRLDTLEKKGKKTTSSLKKGFEGVGKQVTKFAGALAGAFAIQAVVSDAIRIMSSFESQMDKVASITGATNSEMAQLSSSAKTLGSTTAFTASQVGQLQEEFAKLGFSTKEILEATEATLALAAATKSDLATAATVAGATVRGFSLDASETQRVVDVMAKSFSASALDMTKFQVAMATVAPVAADAGASLEETTALLGLLADRGLDASTAGTSLRNIFLTLSERGLTFNEAMERINNSTDKSGESLQLFGKRGAVAGSIIAQNADQVAELTGKLNDAQGVAQEMADRQLDNLAGKVTILGSAWEGFVLGLDDGNGSLSEFLEGSVEAATAILNLATVTDKQSEALEDQQVALNVLVGQITDANAKEEDRVKLIEALNEEYPDFLKNLDQEKVTNEQLAVRLAEVNDQLVQRIIIQKQQEKLEEAGADLAESRISAAEQEIELREAIIKTAKNQDQLNQLQNKTLEEQIDLLIDAGGDYNNLRQKLEQYQFRLGDVKSAEDDLNSVQLQKKAILDSLGITQEELNEKTEDSTEVAEDLSTAEVALTNTIKALRQEETKLKDELNNLEIGSSLFISTREKLKNVTDELTIAEGKETEAMKAATKAREKAEAEGKKVEEERKKRAKARLDRIKKEAFAELEAQEDAIFRSKDLATQENLLFNDRLRDAGLFGQDRQDLTEHQLAALEQLEKEHAENLVKIEKDRADKETEIREEEFEQQKELQLRQIENAAALGAVLQQFGENAKQRRLEEMQTEIDVLNAKENLTEQEKTQIEEKEAALEAFSKKSNALLTAGLVLEKAAAVANIIVSTQVEIAKIGATFGALPLVAAPLIAAAKIRAALGIASVAATVIPQVFHEGEIDIRPGVKNRKGEFQATLMERESVINPQGTLKYRDELQAANDLTLDKLIQDKYVAPALQKAVIEMENAKGMNLADNIANSLSLNASLDPLDIMRMNNKSKRNSMANAKYIVDGISRSNKDMARLMRLEDRRKF